VPTEQELLEEERALLERKKQLLEQRSEREKAGKPRLNIVGRIGQGVGQGLSFGFVDELAAGLAAAVKSPLSDKTFGEVYDEQLAVERGDLASARKDSPYITGASEIAGGALQGGALLKAGTAIAPNIIAKAPLLARLGGVGAAEGALYGAGSSEEGERIGGALKGGAIGAIAAPIGYYVGNQISKGVRAVGRALGRIATNTPERQAEAIIQRAFEADDLSAAAAREELDRLGPQAVLADLGENLSTTARGAAARTGGARTLASNLLDERQLGQQSRLLDAAGGSDFNVANFKEEFSKAMTQRQSQAAPLYEEAYQAPMQMTDKLKALLQRPALNSAMQRAMTIVKDEGLQGLDTEMSPVRIMDAAKQELDDQIGSALRSGERNTARRLLRIKGDLLAEVDAQVPSYKAAREIFSNEAALRDAGSLGRSLLTTRVDMDAAEIAVEAMTEGERHAFRLGAIRGLVDKLEGTAETRNAAGKLVESVRGRDLLKMAFPDEATLNRFIRTAESESQFSFTRNRVLSGSPTARIQEDVKALDEGASWITALARGDKISVGAKLLKRLGFGGASEETLNEVAKILFNRKVPERQLERVAIGAAQQAPSIARQGALAGASSTAATSYLED
jgi:hypothetical protein